MGCKSCLCDNHLNIIDHFLAIVVGHHSWPFRSFLYQIHQRLILYWVLCLCELINSFLQKCRWYRYYPHFTHKETVTSLSSSRSHNQEVIEPGYDAPNQSEPRTYVITSDARPFPEEEVFRQDASIPWASLPHSKMAVGGMR